MSTHNSSGTKRRALAAQMRRRCAPDVRPPSSSSAKTRSLRFRQIAFGSTSTRRTRCPEHQSQGPILGFTLSSWQPPTGQSMLAHTPTLYCARRPSAVIVISTRLPTICLRSDCRHPQPMRRSWSGRWSGPPAYAHACHTRTHGDTLHERVATVEQAEHDLRKGCPRPCGSPGSACEWIWQPAAAKSIYGLVLSFSSSSRRGLTRPGRPALGPSSTSSRPQRMRPRVAPPRTPRRPSCRKLSDRRACGLRRGPGRPLLPRLPIPHRRCGYRSSAKARK
jgi:hypothetical protein